MTRGRANRRIETPGTAWRAGFGSLSLRKEKSRRPSAANKDGQDSQAMAVPGRLELPTFGLGNRCSIRLSYGTIGYLTSDPNFLGDGQRWHQNGWFELCRFCPVRSTATSFRYNYYDSIGFVLGRITYARHKIICWRQLQQDGQIIVRIFSGSFRHDRKYLPRDSVWITLLSFFHSGREQPIRPSRCSRAVAQ